jgi:hypothetical protein
MSKEKILYTGKSRYLGFGEKKQSTFIKEDNKIIEKIFNSDYWNTRTTTKERSKEYLLDFLYKEERNLLKQFNEELKKITDAIDKIEREV